MRKSTVFISSLAAVVLFQVAGPVAAGSTSDNIRPVSYVVSGAPAAPGPASRFDSGFDSGFDRDLRGADALATSFIGKVIAAHNRYRAALGLAPLSWSNTLAAGASEWATRLALENRFEHSRDDGGESAYGENLASSTGEPTADGLVDLWGAEQREYVPGQRFPDVSRNGDWSAVGHYTQVVWRDTAEVGCGLAKGATKTILVCRYLPAGNWLGELPY